VAGNPPRGRQPDLGALREDPLERPPERAPPERLADDEGVRESMARHRERTRFAGGSGNVVKMNSTTTDRPVSMDKEHGCESAPRHLVADVQGRVLPARLGQPPDELLMGDAPPGHLGSQGWCASSSSQGLAAIPGARAASDPMERGREG